MTVEAVRVAPEWLRVREPADAAARSVALVDGCRSAVSAHFAGHLPAGPIVVHDLGAGTGSMGRWLAPRLDGDQHWVLHDHDPWLLARATAGAPLRARDGAPVTVESRCDDIVDARSCDLGSASLVTASALLDMFTGDEVDRFVEVASSPGCPVLVTISVIGRVDLLPADPLDRLLAAAFNAHQRRRTVRGRLLGPDAVGRVVRGFEGRGAEVVVRPSPWRLGVAHAALAAEWLLGWVGAACEQHPGLHAAAAPYLERRLAQASAGRLAVTVHHLDLLARFP